MQASLAVIGFLLGCLAAWQAADWRWLVGASLLVSNWPYTLIIILPVNKALEATEPKQAGARTRALIEQWGWLHSVRSALGAAATLAFLWSLTAR